MRISPSNLNRLFNGCTTPNMLLAKLTEMGFDFSAYLEVENVMILAAALSTAGYLPLNLFNASMESREMLVEELNGPLRRFGMRAVNNPLPEPRRFTQRKSGFIVECTPLNRTQEVCDIFNEVSMILDPTPQEHTFF